MACDFVALATEIYTTFVGVNTQEELEACLENIFDVCFTFPGDKPGNWRNKCHAEERHGNQMLDTTQPMNIEVRAANYSKPDWASAFGSMEILNTARVEFLDHFRDRMDERMAKTGDSVFHGEIEFSSAIGTGVHTDGRKMGIAVVHFVYENIDGKWYEISAYPIAEPKIKK